MLGADRKHWLSSRLTGFDPTAFIGRIAIPQCSGFLGVLSLEPYQKHRKKPMTDKTLEAFTD